MSPIPFPLLALIKKNLQPQRQFHPGKTWLEVGKKTYDHKEITLGIKALLEGRWSQGKYVDRFEKKFAASLGRKYCLTTNSGSSANLLAVTALTSPLLQHRRLKPGDEIITAACGFPTTVNPIIQNQLRPVFVDVDLTTLNVSPSSLKKALSSKTKAVILAHSLGNPFNASAIGKFCHHHHLYLIEDNCDALGSRFKGKYTGTFGDLATHSFYPAHHMTMGEGGAVVTDNKLLAQIVTSLRDWGRYLDKPIAKRGELPQDYDQRYTFYELGYNLKITEMQAAIGLAQLKKLKSFTKTRIKNGNYLLSQLTALPGLIKHEATEFSQPSWFGIPVTIDPKAPFSRQRLIKYLHSNRIDTRLFLAGNITKQPYMRQGKYPYRVSESLKNTNIVMKQTFWVGCSPALTKEALRYVAKLIKQFTFSHYDQPQQS